MGSTGRKLVTILAVSLLIFCATLLAMMPEADAAALDLREVSIDYRHFFPGGSYPLITENGLPNRTLGTELNLTVKIDVLKYLYWDNTIHSMTDKVIEPDGTADGGQFRLVGWEFGFGIDFRRVWDFIPVRVGYWHFSQHALDHVFPWHYPVQDAIGVQLIIYQRKD